MAEAAALCATGSVLASGRSLRTRAALIAAGRQLFAARPIDAVSVDELVVEAGVAKGSFYNHFADKDGLLAAVVAEVRSGIEARIAQMNAGVKDPAVRVVRAICIYGARVASYPAEGLVLMRNDERGVPLSPLNEGLVQDLGAGLHTGRMILPSVEAGSLYVVGVAHSVLLAAVRNRDVGRTLIEAQQLCMLLLRAMGLPYPQPETIAAQTVDDIFRANDIDRKD
ncbi:TetR/AcrR family transcriptional regulator [Sphingomonas sp.]|uniref:TetR/AcrR family transcriptional regulator n=1 Tax=Sphingomonas sp. TaxID=28214 RepID=UPI0017DA4598|nr:TetR/AcrR family transcriptional regulator [Sphingomonas sp.]MBA4761829.1 TetR/AcrR family transcriptional regulator [Sphingomonas sp.]